MPMDSSVSDLLEQLLAEHGRGLIGQPKRLEALLRDHCPQHRREVNLLLMALSEGVPQELLQTASIDTACERRLSFRLQTERALQPEAAVWAVRSWVECLQPSRSSATSVPAPPVPSPAPAPSPAPTVPAQPVAPLSRVAPALSVAPPGSGGPVSPPRPRWIGYALSAGLVALMVFIVFPRPQTIMTNRRNSSARSTNSVSVQPPATAQRGDTWTNPRDGAEMVYIPAGDFIMGSNNNDDEKPQHRVQLDSYWMYRHEVTVAQYRKFCQATGTSMPPAPSGGLQDKHPIVNVSWNDALAYCDWAGVELPTEAQWEGAARGTDGRTWPWGNKWDAKKCNTEENGPESTTPVGAYPEGVSPYGCLDMAGNVWEWCADWYAPNYYLSRRQARQGGGGKNAPQRNPSGPSTGQYRVLRGGGWFSNSGNARCANRDSLTPDFVVNFIGFRCARTL